MRWRQRTSDWLEDEGEIELIQLSRNFPASSKPWLSAMKLHRIAFILHEAGREPAHAHLHARKDRPQSRFLNERTNKFQLSRDWPW